MFAALALALAPAAAETHPFSVHDMLAMDRLTDPVVSPEGDRILFTVRVTDVEANKGRTDVWIVNVDGSGLKQLTNDPANDSGARFSADGKSAWFLSTRSGSSQLWRMAIDGGEAEQMTRLPLDVEGFVPFRDGKRVLLVLDVYPELARDQVIAETAARDEKRSKSKVQARTYESLPFRHWDTWEDGKRLHLFAWTIGGEAVDLMSGLDGDAPTKPFGGTEEIAISPDGATVVFACHVAAKDRMWTTNVELYGVPSDGSSPPRCLTGANPAYDNQPRFSPDGLTLAYLAMARPGYESDRQRIVLLDWPSKKTRVLTEGWDRSPGEITWSSDGKKLYATADNLGQKSLFSIDAQSGAVKTLLKEGTYSSPLQAGNRLVFGLDTLKSPVELHTCALDGSDVRAITSFNAAKLARTRMGEFEQFTFSGAKGATVHGYLVKPVDFDATRRYPLAFLIHGGPQGSFGNHFHYRWNPQAHAGAGFAAVMIDFHASTGYGQAFTDAVNGDWGGAPYEDLMLGLDHVLAKHAFLDGSRVAALGASYGGYMINWIAGNTDRFRCLVNHDGNLDERMAYFDTEELWFPEWEHGGTPWDNPAGYAKHNPIDLVKNWKTPMLVIHGGLDFRVVDTQGMSTFTALQRKGIPSKFLYFPDENHWVLKPQNSILWHETVLEWTTRWTREESAARPASSPR